MTSRAQTEGTVGKTAGRNDQIGWIMARQDVYGPLLYEALRTTEEPMTLPQAAERAGSSVKRAYAWADKNRSMLVASSHKGPNGGVSYMTRDNPHRGKQTFKDGDGKHETVKLENEPARLGIGTTLVVVSMGLRGGKVELELMAAGGETIRVVVNGDGSDA